MRGKGRKRCVNRAQKKSFKRVEFFIYSDWDEAFCLRGHLFGVRFTLKMANRMVVSANSAERVTR